MVDNVTSNRILSGSAICEFTVTVNFVAPLLFSASYAIHSTVVGPMSKKNSSVLSSETIGINSPSAKHVGPDVTAVSSVTVGSSNFTVAPFEIVASVVMSCFWVNTGGWLSPSAFVLIIVILNDFSPFSPTSSYAIQYTKWGPTENNEPDDGVHVGCAVIPTLSVACAVA